MRKYAGGRIPNNGQLASKDASNCLVLLWIFCDSRSWRGSAIAAKDLFRGKGKREEDWRREIQAWLRSVLPISVNSETPEVRMQLFDRDWSILRLQFETTMEICNIILSDSYSFWSGSFDDRLILLLSPLNCLIFIQGQICIMFVIWLWLHYNSTWLRLLRLIVTVFISFVKRI